MVLGFGLAPSVPLPQSEIPSTLATVVSGPMKGPLDLSIPAALWVMNVLFKAGLASFCLLLT